eukprot:7377723-Prymnesium_polylepis.1
MPGTPEAPSVCAVIPFSPASVVSESLPRRARTAELIEPVSMGSPRAVPVPCVSMYTPHVIGTLASS